MTAGAALFLGMPWKQRYSSNAKSIHINTHIETI